MIGTAGATPVPTQTETGRLGLPPVATAVPQPEPVEATFGRTATVTSVSLFGDKSTTIEVISAGTIEGVSGIYRYNMNHLQLIPAAELARWDGSDGPHQPTLVAGMEPSLRSATISEGDRIVGSLVFDVFDTALDDHVLVLRSLLVPDGPAAAFWRLDGVVRSPVR